MSRHPQQLFALAHPSDVSMARRGGLQLARTLGFDEVRAGELAIAITELGTNILRHAERGQLLLTPVEEGGNNRVAVLGLDSGPGISDLADSMRDGSSTIGSSGTGLGAMRRLADEFDVYSLPGQGSGFYFCFWSRRVSPPPGPVQTGAVCLPMMGEGACGDAWAAETDARSATFLVCDGLGHGPEAARASAAAVDVLSKHRLPPVDLVKESHQALRGTRGAALGIARLTFQTSELDFAGVGNISACVLDGGKRRSLISHNGIVGYNMRKTQQVSTTCPSQALLIMQSDGLGTHWDLAAYPGLCSHHPALIAGILYRDHSRNRDDVTVLVVKPQDT